MVENSKIGRIIFFRIRSSTGYKISENLDRISARRKLCGDSVPCVIWTDALERMGCRTGMWNGISHDIETVSYTHLDVYKRQSVYSVIILDIGNGMEDVFQLLRLCDQILMPCAEDVYAMAKIAQYQHKMCIRDRACSWTGVSASASGFSGSWDTASFIWRRMSRKSSAPSSFFRCSSKMCIRDRCHGLHRGLQLLHVLQGRIYLLLRRVLLLLSFQGSSLCCLLQLRQEVLRI